MGGEFRWCLQHLNSPGKPQPDARFPWRHVQEYRATPEHTALVRLRTEQLHQTKNCPATHEAVHGRQPTQRNHQEHHCHWRRCAAVPFGSRYPPVGRKRPKDKIFCCPPVDTGKHTQPGTHLSADEVGQIIYTPTAAVPGTMPHRLDTISPQNLGGLWMMGAGEVGTAN